MNIAYKIKNWLFLFSFLLFCIPILAETNIAPRIEKLKPLMAGDPAPTFTVYKVDGSEFHFNPDNLEHPTLIIFYRGGWCGACNQQLRDVSNIMAKIMELGINVIFPNGDRPEIMYSSLKHETKQAIAELDYLLLSDSDLNAAQAFSVAYVLDDEILNRYRSRKEWDLHQSSIDKYDALPLPSVFIINTDGIIAFQYHNLDPRIRLSSEDLLKEIKKIVDIRPDFK